MSAPYKVEDIGGGFSTKICIINTETKEVLFDSQRDSNTFGVYVAILNKLDGIEKMQEKAWKLLKPEPGMVFISRSTLENVVKAKTSDEIEFAKQDIATLLEVLDREEE